MSDISIKIEPVKKDKILIEGIIYYPNIDIKIYNHTNRAIKIEKLLLSILEEVDNDDNGIPIINEPIIINTTFYSINKFNIMNFITDDILEKSLIIKVKIENQIKPINSNDFVVL